MTVTATDRRAGPFYGNGVATQFPFTFKVFSAADLEVTYTDADGVATVITSGFTVTLNADQDANPGGYITYPLTGSPMANPASLVAVGATAYTQPAAFSNVGRFLPEVHERAFDRTIILVQQLRELLQRQLTIPPDGPFPVSALPSKTARLDKLVSFNSVTGQPEATAFTATQLVSVVAAVYAGSAGPLDALSFIQAGTGAETRTAQNKAREIVSVTDYMTTAERADALGRLGTVDVSGAVIDAQTHLVSLGGGTLIWPAGVYGLGAVIPLKSNVVHMGAGRGLTVTKALHNGNVFGEAFPAAAVEYSGIRGISINGNKAALSFPADDADGNAIRLNQVSRSVFDVEVYDSIFNGISVYNLSNDNVFLWPRLTNIGKSGTPPGAASWTGIFFEFSANRNLVLSAHVDTTLQYGIWIGARDADNVDNVLINPYVANTTSDGIRIGDDVTANVCYRPVVINPNVVAAGDVGLRIFHAGTGSVQSARVIGGSIRGCTNLGMLTDTACNRALITGVTLDSNGPYNLTDVGTNNKFVGIEAFGASVTDIRKLGTNGRFIGCDVIDGRAGVFTPQILTGGAAVGRTYSSQDGSYRVNGNCVEFCLSVVLTAKGSSTGALTISGLPFNSAASGTFASVSPQYAKLTLGGAGFNVFGLILNAANTITLYEVESTSGSTALTDAALADDTEFYISGRYFI